MKQSDQDLKCGEDLANAVLPLIQRLSAQAGVPFYWWSGFIAAIMGFAGASIGPDALKVLTEGVSEIVTKFNQENAH